MPLNVKKTLLKAKSLAKKGDAAAAAQLYTAVLESFPQNSQASKGLAALSNTGSSAAHSGLQAPQEQLEALVRLYNTGHLQRALEQGELLAAQYPREPIIHNLLGATSNGLGNPDQAIVSFTRALQLKPDYTEVHCNLGSVLRDMGRIDEAIASYLKAIRIEPDYSDAHYNLGNALKRTGREEEAIRSYRRALEFAPNYAEVHNNLGNALKTLGRNEEAKASFNSALRLKPNFAEAHCNLGNLLSAEGVLDEAIACYARAAQRRPGYATAQGNLLHLQAALCDWSMPELAEVSIADLGVAAESVEPFALLALEDHPARHRLRSETYAKSQYRNSELPEIERPEVKPERLRIGYYSADFYNHATMHLMAKLFELHDTSKFDIYIYSYGSDEDDEMRRRLRAVAVEFYDVRELSDKAVAELSRSHGIDIAVDLKGYTRDTRSGIFSYRAAPLQINYLGYPGTMGAAFMDYIIADKSVIPESQVPHYSEQIIYMPHSYQVNDSSRQIAEEVTTRAEAGLPETGFVFCCFNNSYKISAREFDIWMRLLDKVDGSVLWLYQSNEWVQDNVRAQAKKRGIDPQRIVLAGRMELPQHLARHRLADLFLDSFNYNAHTTASDALWAGLPVITKTGQGFASRVGASLLNAVGLPELITESEQDYEKLALELALDTERLDQVKQKLSAKLQTSPLFDSAGFTRDIEEAYQQAYQRYFDGEAPGMITVQGS